MDADEPRKDSGSTDSGRRGRVLRFESLAEGAVFAGRYEIREPLGAGGSGEVYRAFDRVARIEVALKVLFPGTTDRDLERLRREVRLARSLQHPGILRVHDIGETDGFFYTVSELLHGESLSARIRREGRLGPEETERILRGVLGALAVAHAAGVIHRDVKPGNVFLTAPRHGEDARIVLLDFGLARPVGEAGLTATGLFVGTPEYCSPEQIRGEKNLTPASDVYACGITLWEMLSGRPPFHGISLADVFNAHLFAPLPPSRFELRGVPPRLRALVSRMLEKSPADRPASAREVLELLRRKWTAWDAAVALAREVRGRASRRAVRVTVGASATVVALAAVAIALAVPVRVTPDGTRLVWETRAGISLRGVDLGRGITSAVLGADRGLFSAEALVAVNPMPASETTPFDVGGKPPMLYRVKLPSGWREPVLTQRSQDVLFAARTYPFYNPMLLPKGLVPLRTREGVRPLVLAVRADHPFGYPSRIAFLDSRGAPVQYFDHPGYVETMMPCPIDGGRTTLLLAGAFNNLLGPREALFALDVGAAPRGQAPPFTGESLAADTARWYLPLPYDPTTGDFGVEVSGGTVEVTLTAGRRIAVDLATGVPLDPALRGGRSESDWRKLRLGWVDALARAQKLNGAGDPEGGAALLETFADGARGDAILRSTALYRAARLRLLAAATDGEPALLRALDLTESALAEEPEPPRYRLLEAEILARLGRLEDARASLLAWRSKPSHRMYQYEYLLIARLARLPLDVRDVAADEGWAEHGSEDHLTRIADALLKNRPDEVIEDKRRWLANDVPFQSHHYFLAEARLARARPDAEAALREVEEGASSRMTGVPVPLALVKLRALLLAGRPVGPDDVHEASRDLDDVVSNAFTSMETLFILRYAADDAAWILARRPDLGELRPWAERAKVLADRWWRFRD